MKIRLHTILHNLLAKVIAWIVYLVYYWISPLYRQIKVILYSLIYPRLFWKVKYHHIDGGLTTVPVNEPEDLNKICFIYEVPDKNIWTTYWRTWNKLNRFTVGFTFNEWCKCDKNDLFSFKATIADYKNKYLLNFNYNSNYGKEFNSATSRRH